LDIRSNPTFTHIDERPTANMATHEQYILHVTAGATYDTSKHEDVLVNSEKPVDISSDLIDARVHMRIKDYRGTPSHLDPSIMLPLQHSSH